MLKPGIEQSLFPGSFAKKFGEGAPVKLTNDTIIKSVSYSQTEILQWIMALYCPNGFDLDPTYSKGNFYKNIVEPKYKFDISPGPGIAAGDVRFLPIKSETLESAIFDPPFLGAVPVQKSKGRSNIIKRRFGAYKGFDALWSMYRGAMSEFFRVLKNNGVLVVKCQDGVNDHKQYLSHVEIINTGLQLGFYPKDLFVLLAKSVIIGGNHHRQEHSRKAHSYFLVFQKRNSPVIYSN